MTVVKDRTVLMNYLRALYELPSGGTEILSNNS